MNAVGLYVSAARLVLQNDVRDYGSSSTSHTDQSFLDLFRLLPHLRQSLSCAVCTRMLCDPFALKDARCQHNVCRLCVRGRKQIRPSCTACRDCQDFKIYEENKQMRCLLLCYKSLCEHLLASPLFQVICKQRTSPMCISSGIAVPTMSAQEFIKEGANYDDVLNVFSVDLPRPKLTPTAILSNTSCITSSAASLVPISVPALPLPKAAATPTTPQQQLTHTFPMPVVIKQEHVSPPLCNTLVQHKPPTYGTTPPALTVKNLKNIVDLSSAVQLTAASMSSVSALPHTVTYVGHATSAGGIVVPLVSSSPVSTVTNAPLTIASAKLQSLSRQIAAQHQRNMVSVSSTSCLDLKPSLTFKLASTTSTAPTAAVVAAASSTSLGITTTTATVTSQQVRNPPPIKTVSNGSAMYSVLYTGIGNKITIKRKTDGDDDGALKKNYTTASAAVPTSQSTSATTVFRQVSKTNAKRRGCRCGNATPTPGKLTCCGQRCPCYVDSKSCIGCKCRGCRNPHRPDGGKVRPVIPELACYEIQMADSEHTVLSPGELPIATATSNKLVSSSTAATSTTTCTTTSGQQVEMSLDNLISSATPPQQQLHQPQVPPTSRLTILPTTSSTTTTTTSASNIIPFRNLQQINAAVNAQQQQHQQSHATVTAISAPQQQQQLQQQPGGNVLQLENLQRESLLIQSAEGKYQVVNVFTTTTSQNIHNNSSLQRIHTLPQLHTVSNSSSNITSNNNGTFLIQSSSSGTGGVSSAGNSHSLQHLHQIPEISTTLPQIIMQQQQQQQQTQSHSVSPHVNNTHQQQQVQRAHLQQQLKSHNNIITVHPINSQIKPTAQVIAPSTITLSPILVTSPNSTYTSTDMFSESSSEEYLNDVNVNSAAFQPTKISVSTASHVSAAHTSPYTLVGSNSAVGTGVGGGGGQQHYVELIESNDL